MNWNSEFPIHNGEALRSLRESEAAHFLGRTFENRTKVRLSRVRPAGIEPATVSLKGCCSTN